MSQMPWRFTDERELDQLEVDGVPYCRRFGNPGQSPKGEGLNNCLIDSLRQCLDIVLNHQEAVALGKAVRRDLEAEFDEPLDDQRRLVTRASFWISVTTGRQFCAASSATILQTGLLPSILMIIASSVSSETGLDTVWYLGDGTPQIV